MQYILTEEEFNYFNKLQQRYDKLCNDIEDLRKEAQENGYKNGMRRSALNALGELITTDNGGFKPIPEDWLWKPIDGNIYLNAGNILTDFSNKLKQYEQKNNIV